MPGWCGLGDGGGWMEVVQEAWCFSHIGDRRSRLRQLQDGTAWCGGAPGGAAPAASRRCRDGCCKLSLDRCDQRPPPRSSRRQAGPPLRPPCVLRMAAPCDQSTALTGPAVALGMRPLPHPCRAQPAEPAGAASQPAATEASRRRVGPCGACTANCTQVVLAARPAAWLAAGAHGASGTAYRKVTSRKTNEHSQNQQSTGEIATCSAETNDTASVRTSRRPSTAGPSLDRYTAPTM